MKIFWLEEEEKQTFAPSAGSAAAAAAPHGTPESVHVWDTPGGEWKGPVNSKPCRHAGSAGSLPNETL